ncbi:MAG: hypothetical protein AAF587_34750 [Bacteroidota bacterium]
MKRTWFFTNLFLFHKAAFLLILITGFLSYTPAIGQFISDGNGYTTSSRIGIGVGASSWVNLSVAGDLRLMSTLDRGKTTAPKLLFSNGDGSHLRFSIEDNLTEDALLFDSKTASRYFQFKGRVNIGLGSQAFLTPTGSHSDYYLGVAGKIVAKEVVVSTSTFADYVFEDDYQLTPLEAVEQHISTHKHLHNTPSGKEIIQEGIAVSEMTVNQQEKIEELFLHMIELNKRVKELEKENAALKAQFMKK